MGQSRGGYKKYSDQQKAGALLLLDASTRPTFQERLEEAARQSGVKPQTLQHWYKYGITSNAGLEEELSELREELTLDLKAAVESEVGNIFLEMKVKRDDATYKDLTIAAGILIDKLQLLNDRPTESIKQAITFERRGISTLPEHLASSTVGSIEGSQEI